MPHVFLSRFIRNVSAKEHLSSRREQRGDHAVGELDTSPLACGSLETELAETLFIGG
jgi:hypothetical protein